MLTSFGMFWAAEGAGTSWSGSDAALLLLVLGTAAVGLAIVVLLRRPTIGSVSTAGRGARI